MTTRGVKRLASASISSEVVHNSESKKRRRHILLQESMRRAAKKRAEAAQKVLSELPLSTRKYFAFTKHDQQPINVRHQLYTKPITNTTNFPN
jgi:hypothetical protein